MGIPNRQDIIAALFNIQAGCCFYCDKEVSLKLKNHPDSATVDHIVPQSKGGRNQAHNYVMACKECNESKSDKPLVVFVMERKKLMRGLLKRSVG